MPKCLLGRRYAFSALHTIPQEDFIHGHNYNLDISVSGPLHESGRILSLDSLDQIVRKAFLKNLDRQWVNKSVVPATGENLARLAYQCISEALPTGLRLEKVEIEETRKNGFTALFQ